MSWKNPWSKPNAVDARAQALAEEEAALSLQLEEARQKIQALKNPPPSPTGPPTWRSNKANDENNPPKVSAPTRKLTQRTHRAQQKRDRNRFLLLLALVGLVLLLLINALTKHSPAG